MIITNFKNNGSADGAVNYILSMHDHEGKLRSVKPKILEGDPDLTKDICKQFCSHFKNKTVSGVISFRDDEQPTDEQKRETIAHFKKTFLHGLEDRINVFFVEHNDKNNCEIHYVINRVDLSNGKYINPFSPGEQTKNLMKLFSADLNNKFGFKQVEEKPLKTKYSQNEMKCLRKERHGIKNLKTKKSIDSALNDLVKSGEITNRKELVEFLKEEGYIIARKGEDYLSIENPNGGRNIRFRGGIFAENNGLDYKEVKELANQKPRFSSQETSEKLLAIVAKRSEYNNKRYGSKKLELPTKKAPEVKSAPATAPQQPVTEPINSSPGTAPILPKAATSKASTDNPEPTGGNSVNAGLAGAQSAYDSALAKLRNAKSHIERIRAQQELFRAKLALDNAQEADLEQKNKIKVKI